MSDELNCSDGAKMLIERMQSHPDEFWGGSAKWAAVMSQAHTRLSSSSETYTMFTERDAVAVCKAFDKYVRETRLAAHVIERIMAPVEERKRVDVRMPGKSVLTTKAMQEAALRLMEEEYDKAYIYNTKDRYDLK